MGLNGCGMRFCGDDLPDACLEVRCVDGLKNWFCVEPGNWK